MTVRFPMITLAVALFLLGPGQAAAQDWSASARAENSADRVAMLTLDTLAGQLAVLELQRPELLKRYLPGAGPVELLDRQRQALCAALDALPQGAPKAHEFAAARIVGAIDEKLAGLAVDRVLQGVEREPAHPDMKAIDAMIAELERRRGELNSLESGPVCTATRPKRQ